MTVVVDVVETIVGALVGVVRVPTLAIVGRSSFPFIGTCFPWLCIVPSDLGVAPRSRRLFLVV